MNVDTHDESELARERQRLFGVYPAIVTDVKDPQGQGRVKVKLPWTPDNSGKGYEAWARLATMMGGPNRGTWFIPDPNDEVLVAFEAGDPRRPYVVGALWNGVDKPPESMDKNGKNHIKTIRTRNGVRVSLDDNKGKESLRLETPGGQSIVLSDGPGVIELADSNGNLVRMEAAGITIQTRGKLIVKAKTVQVEAMTITVSCPTSKFSGIVQCDTLKATTVVGSIYMPGIGNFL